jgi:hypothetical protein
MKREINIFHIKPTLLINVFYGIIVGVLFFLLWGNLWWLGFGLGSGLAIGSFAMLKRLKDIKITEHN